VSEAAQVSYRALADKVDAFFARVAAAHPGQMACRRGCALCCHQHLHVLPFEWARLKAAVLALPEEARRQIHARATGPEAPRRCPLLADDDSCSVFEARPMVCRSHGLPLKRGPDRHTCELNFQGALASLAEADVLDEAQLGVMVGLIDRLWAEANPGDTAPRDADGRVPLREALADLLGA